MWRVRIAAQKRKSLLPKVTLIVLPYRASGSVKGLPEATGGPVDQLLFLLLLRSTLTESQADVREVDSRAIEPRQAWHESLERAECQECYAREDAFIISVFIKHLQ